MVYFSILDSVQHDRQSGQVSESNIGNLGVSHWAVPQPWKQKQISRLRHQS